MPKLIHLLVATLDQNFAGTVKLKKSYRSNFAL